MPKGYGVEFGWCGFGHHAGPPRVFCIGWMLIAIFPDGIEIVLKGYRAALTIKRNEVQG